MMFNEQNPIFGMKQRNFLILLFLISFSLRIAYFIILRVLLEKPLMDDETIYFSYAAGLAQNLKYSFCCGGRAYFSPGFSLVLFPFFKLLGSNLFVGGTVNVILSSLIPVVVYYVARDLLNVRCAVYSSIIAAIYPFSIYYSPRLLSETLFTLLFISGLYSLIKARDERSVAMILLSGLLLGYGALTRPVLLLFPLVVIAYLLLKRNFRPGAFIRQILLFLIAFSIPLAPWAYRNQKVIGKPIVSNTNAGKTLYGGNHFLSSRNDENMGTYQFDGGLLAKERGINICCGEVERNEKLLEITVSDLKHNYKKIPYMLYKKFVKFWHIKPDPSRAYWNKNDTMSLLSYGFLLIFFIMGFFKTFRPRANIFLFHLSIIYTVLMALISWGSPRFRFPISPLIIMLACTVLSAIWVGYSSKLKKLK